MITWSDLTTGSHRLTCPECGRGERDKTLGVTIEDGAGVAHCHRCHYIENWHDRTATKRPGKPVSRPVVNIRHERLSDDGVELWSACTGLRGTIGEQYLRARHCAIPPEDGDLRFHPALKHPNGYTGPALVALVTDAITRQPISLHRTWICADGTKAKVDPPRLLLGGHRKQGGVIRLWPDEFVTYGLGIGEGVESTLTLATVLRPAWSLIDAGNLGAFPVLPGIEVLTIAADNDPAGLKAATACATRWTAAGVDVRVVIPPREGTDLNDVAREAD
jgi:putative DNA primase/helicase